MSRLGAPHAGDAYQECGLDVVVGVGDGGEGGGGFDEAHLDALAQREYVLVKWRIHQELAVELAEEWREACNVLHTASQQAGPGALVSD